MGQKNLFDNGKVQQSTIFFTTMNATSRPSFPFLNWPLWVMSCLGFWLSASVMMDFIVIPGLFASGMMAQPGFVGAGYIIFGLFNRVELLCASIVLSGVFWLVQEKSRSRQRTYLGLAGLLLAIALIYTYGLTPALSGIGFEMSSFTREPAMPEAMIELHWLYWGLEIAKLTSGVALLRWCQTLGNQ